MLESLTIQNIVLIDDLHINFEKGLCVLTGETGAGKSILLDALGLALGARAETRLLRQGTSKAQVTAVFSLSSHHPIWNKLEEHGIPFEKNEVIFRRILESDGKSKCYLNDQLISQTLMRRLGQDLVEIHGQFDQLLHGKSQLSALDLYGQSETKPLQEAFKIYQSAKLELKNFHEKCAKSLEREAFLRFAIEEIEKAAPRLEEEVELEAERSLISHRAKIAEALVIVDENITHSLSALSQCHKALTRIHELLPEKIAPLLDASDRAMLESQEIFEEMKILKRDVEGTPHSLETIENRLHHLRALGRKYQTTDLVSSLNDFQEELLLLEKSENYLHVLETAVNTAKTLYLEKAHLLSESRKITAEKLEAAIRQELAPLKLNHAKFHVYFEDLQEESWNESGLDRVEFYIQTNAGQASGPLSLVASGGELSRFMLALKSVLVQSAEVPTLIFDEIESGTGGAVASAIGERLKALSETIQVLAITHSPQIAAYGMQHLMVFKVSEENQTRTHLKLLNQEERREEVARMLSGEEITEEARAAAKRLMGSH